jgi:hypothetical protein
MAYHLPAIFFNDGSLEINSLPSPSLVHVQQSPPPSASFQFCCLFSFFLFFLQGVQSVQGGLQWFIPRVTERYYMMFSTHLFSLPKVSKVRLEWWLVAA